MFIETPKGQLDQLSQGKVSLRLINPNGSREETLEEMISGVEALQRISLSIFGAIKGRLDEQRVAIKALDERVNKAAERVQQVKGSAKALRIISTAKYPPTDDAEAVADEGDGRLLSPFLKPLVMAAPPSLTRKSSVDQEDKALSLIPARTSLPTRFEPPVQHPDELLACFHVREVTLPSLASALATPGLGGSGGPPPGLENVDSFLLFNTAENPYQHYRLPGKTSSGSGLRGGVPRRDFLDSSSAASKRAREEAMSPAGEEEDKRERVLDDFYYSPSTLDIPDIDVPDQLPDLPGIVENLDFSPLNEGFTTNQPFFSFSTPKTPQTPTAAASAPTPPPSSTSVVEKPAPQPISSSASAVQPSKTMPGMAPPPPPPPPPTAAAMIQSPISKPSTTPSSGDVDRSNLMEAIRSAGGAGKAALRSAQERKYEAKKKRKEEEKEKVVAAAAVGGDGQSSTTSSSSAPVALDLMADLKNSLAMRRKGISGIREPPRHAPRPQVQGGVGGIMQKLAATIPALEKSTEEDDEVGEGDSDEEEENDDWD